MPLVRRERSMVCSRGHSFDLARSGYLNLLQPQDRRSRKPGDAEAAVAARRRLHDRGVSAQLLRAVREMADARASDVVLDAGCGEGFHLGSLAEEIPFEGHGLDIAVPAIDAAARRYQGCQWIVANADRFVPYTNGSFSLVMSITARMNSPEFRRVIRDDGRLLVAIPAPEDLIELRGAGRDRVSRTVEAFSKEFRLIDLRPVTAVSNLDAEAVADVLLTIYRPLGSRPVEAMRVTFALDLLLFRPI
jgi:23S rRNA (guanine745-N1)-methyltransferase